MRDRIYLVGFLLGAGLLLYLGRDLLEKSTLVTWSLTFAGTTAAGVLGLTLYRVQLELRASRHELARKEAELNFALEVQQALFPRRFPTDAGLEFAGLCVPARGISGDYYDVLRLPDGRLVFTIADISGKGISAAILMSNLHAVARTLAGAGSSPEEVCSRLNRHLYEVTSGERFATFFYAEWQRADRSLRYVNAGHNAPLLLTSLGGSRLDAGAPPLGIFPDTEFKEKRVSLQPGDLLVLYSDGVTEARNEREIEFGESRLEALAAARREAPLADIQQQVLKAVRHWAGEEVEDDMTLLVVRASGPGQEAV
jgi:sigma-B regulation protein RsbU (phosphoserine phosphatase)